MAVPADREQARLLNLKLPSPLLAVNRKSYSADNIPLDFLIRGWPLNVVDDNHLDGPRKLLRHDVVIHLWLELSVIQIFGRSQYLVNNAAYVIFG